jgi:hypothetical protein
MQCVTYTCLIEEATEADGQVQHLFQNYTYSNSN